MTSIAEWLAAAASEPFAYLTTTGRVTGTPHEIEIWFAPVGRTVYFLSGDRGRTDWIRNLKRDPNVTVRIAGRLVRGDARVVRPDSPEDTTARDLLWRKYTGPDNDLVSWRGQALPIAVDLDETEGR